MRGRMMSTGVNALAYDAYKKIKNKKDKFGILHKTIIHAHTPSSYDYKLHSDWDVEEYKKCTAEVLKDEFFKLINLNINQEYMKFDKIMSNNYESEKELFSYLLIAGSLIYNEVELIIVSDHNTISGINKLKEAIKIYKENITNSKIYPEVINGVEISCADRVHVVGIFGNDKVECVKKYIEENIMSEDDGTYKTSLEVLEYFNDSLNEFAYIAHANSTDIFKDTFMAGAYKKKIFTSKYLQYIGVSMNEKRDQIINLVKNKSGKNATVNVLLDNDSHCIEELSTKHMWVKGNKINIDMFKEAILDYDISISFGEDIIKPAQYIEGIFVSNGMNAEKAFLKNMGKNEFIIKFSPALNCLIGGRGTGKSTVIELIEYAFNQHCTNPEKLEFICNHGTVFLLCSLNNREYIVEMNMPLKKKEKHIYQYFGKNSRDRYDFRYNYSNSIDEYAFKNNLNVYEVRSSNEIDIRLIRCGNKREIISKLFETSYSVNELVNTASGEQIQKFIKDKMFANRTLSKPELTIRAISKKGLIESFNSLNEIRKKRKKEVEDIIAPFNSKQKDILRISYNLSNNFDDPNLLLWLFNMDDSAQGERLFKKYMMTVNEIVDYLLYIFDKEGICELLNLLNNENIDLGKYPLYDFANTSKIKNDFQGEIIDSNNQKEVVNEIYQLFKKMNINYIKNYLKDFVRNNERLFLEFNINSRNTTTHTNSLFKDVSTLSLGQKVVAMLDFILAFSDYSNDFKPLIIDQPEDNLDSQYIYKNLVKQIKDTKSKRQIIIATHNATLVTNTLAEQVCVMKSDGIHGWIEAEGYPGETQIKNHIINYLEGGKDSFKHKIIIYEKVLK